MTNKRPQHSGASNDGNEDKLRSERQVFVVPHEQIMGLTDEQLNLPEMWRVFWGGKWIIMAVTILFGAASVFYAFTTTEWFKSDVLLAPSDQDRSQGLLSGLGNMGGLASLTGLRIDNPRSAEAIAVLRSRDFTRSFIQDRQLIPVLFADRWDAEAERWKAKNPEEWPDVRDAIDKFDESVRTVSEDAQTGLTTLSIEWIDPATAADWASDLVSRINMHLRRRAIRQAEQNIAYLEEQLTSTEVLTLRESIGRLLESELQKLMLAEGNEQFAFRVIDSAQIPKERSRPNRVLIVFVSLVLGGLLATILVFVRRGLQKESVVGVGEDQ